MVLAGGEGTRLRPLTSTIPKPLLPVANRPLVEHALRLLRRHGIREVVVTLQFLAPLIRNYLGGGSDLGVEITYATEAQPLGTAGAVKQASDLLDGTFLVISGDVLTDINLEEAVEFHKSRGAIATLVLTRRSDPLDFGIVVAGEDGAVLKFLEKPGWGEVFSDTVNTGIYVLEPGVLAWVGEGPTDFSQEVFPLLLKEGLPVYGMVAEGYWADVGTLEAYVRANRDALEGKVRLDPAGFPVGPGIHTGEGALVEEGALLRPPVMVGNHCRVEEGAFIGPYTVLGHGVVVKRGATLEGAILHDNAYVGPGAWLHGCVVGRNSDIRSAARVGEGAVIGDEVVVEEEAVVKEGVKVFPFRRISRGAIVTKSLVRESVAPERLFAGGLVEGVLNVDLTPELAVRVAMAFGSVLDPGSRVAVSRDPGRGARAIKRAVIAGLTAVGVNCEDLEVAPLSAARYFTFASGAAGGISVRTRPGDPHTVRMLFFDAAGKEIPEALRRQAERVFFREGFRRALPHELGDVRLARWLQPYVEALTSWLSGAEIGLSRGERRPRLRVVLDAGNGSVALVLPLYLGRLGVESLVLGGELDPRLFAEAEQNLSARLERVGELVRNSGAALGAVLDEGGEGLVLVDEVGLPLSPERALLLFVRLVGGEQGGSVVVPFSATSLVEEVAREEGLEVIRTPMGTSRLLAETAVPGRLLVSDAQGRFGFPDFFPGFDAFVALGLLVRAVESGRSLSSLLEGMPTPAVLTAEVQVSWEAKGRVMRLLLQALERERVEVMDGVKVTTPEGWVLVAPDPTRAVIRLWAEGRDPARGGALLEEYVAMVTRLAGEG